MEARWWSWRGACSALTELHALPLTAPFLSGLAPQPNESFPNDIGVLLLLSPGEELSSYQVLFQIRTSLAITLLILVMLALHYRPTDSPDVEALITWAVLDGSTTNHRLTLNTTMATSARYSYP